MIVGAYQFAVTGNIRNNYNNIHNAIIEASRQGVRLLIFPECAITGYPPSDIGTSADVDYEESAEVCKEIENLAKAYDMYVLVGMITKENGEYFNSAILFSPNEEHNRYDKRALWGWDSDNFTAGSRSGIFKVDDIKIGVRICFEVRFPEYFRELFEEQTALNVILFYDVADKDDIERYEMIKAHIKTRAVENVTHTLTVNSIRPYQAAPTGIYDKSGYAMKELVRNKEGLLVFNFRNSEDDFGEKGRRLISNQLIEKFPSIGQTIK